jgi:hypothetical protein
MRNLLGAVAAALTLWAALEFNDAQCQARWQGLTATYSLLSGCLVEVDLLKVPEGSVSVPVERPRIHLNWVR